MDDELLVAETFLSLQGEGLHAGRPCFFIRLSGCNLRCAYCDTRWAREGGESRPLAGLLEEWRASRVGLVEVTGGEPLLQPGAVRLLEALLVEGAEVLLETNGSQPVKGLPEGTVKILDWKTPGSGEESSFLRSNLGELRPGDQVKFVVTGREDYEWARPRIMEVASGPAEALLTPAWNLLSPQELADWILEDRLPARLSLQLHKLIWGDVRGR